ncbi:MAG: hypothetical protein AB7D28_10165 [Candidatus Berkiella sp.]
MIDSNIDKLMYAYVESLYQHSKGFQNYSDSQKHEYMSQDICYVYGELLYPSTVKMIKKLKLSNSDVLLDLGSGLGKFALQIFLRSQVKKVIGIEATESLYLQSKQKIEIAEQQLPFFWENDRELSLIAHNFLDMDWSVANIIYSCSTCFTQELLYKIGEKINQTSSITQVLSLRPISSIERLKLHQVFSIECSWDSALCFWYRLPS